MLSPTVIASKHYLNPEAADAVALIAHYAIDQMIPEEHELRFVKDVKDAQGLFHTRSYKEHIINDDLGKLVKQYEVEVQKFINGGNIDYGVYCIFFDYFVNNGLIPYGIAKARTGDPQNWIASRLEDYLNH